MTAVVADGPIAGAVSVRTLHVALVATIVVLFGLDFLLLVHNYLHGANVKLDRRPACAAAHDSLCERGLTGAAK